MKEYLVFWTFQANYASHPCRVEAKNFQEAACKATIYDPYKADNGKRMRFIIFEVGGDLVWDGELPHPQDSNLISV